MKRLFSFLLFSIPALALVTRAETTPEISILRLPLPTGNETVPVRITSSPQDGTEVVLPYAIDAANGRGFTADPGEVDGDFQISARQGESFFFVTPLTTDARRTLHVMMQGGKVFSVEFITSSRDLGVRRVTFLDTQAAKTIQAQATQALQAARTPPFEAKRMDAPPSKTFKPATSDLQIGVIRTMQMLANLTEPQARKVVAANHALSLAVSDKAPKPPRDFGDYSLQTHFVLRNNVIDAVGFAVTISNKTSAVLTFEPDSFTVRAGDFVYLAGAVDFNPAIKPGESHVAFFVIASSADGRPNRLAVDGDFQISLNKPLASNEAHSNGGK